MERDHTGQVAVTIGDGARRPYSTEILRSGYATLALVLSIWTMRQASIEWTLVGCHTDSAGLGRAGLPAVGLATTGLGLTQVIFI